MEIITIFQLKLMFVDECEKVKNLIHVHSFGHDFHLRSIQDYISKQHRVLNPGTFDIRKPETSEETLGTPCEAADRRHWPADILKPGYHLTGLLRDFETVYPYAPSFSRNFMLKGITMIFLYRTTS